MTANTKTNVNDSLMIAFVDGIRASVSVTELPAVDSPVVCFSRLS